MLQFTKKDALTELFNRQAFYSSVESYRKDITAVIAYQAAGGGCGVARRCDITGFFFQYNGYIGFPEKLKDGTYRNSEAGTTPMVEMDMNDVYDLAKLDAKLKQINA